MKKALFACIAVAALCGLLAGPALADEAGAAEHFVIGTAIHEDLAPGGDFFRALQLISAIRALGGEIAVKDGTLVINLELDEAELEALRKALTSEHPWLAFSMQPSCNRDCIMTTHSHTAAPGLGSHERFLLGKREQPACASCGAPPEADSERRPVDRPVKVLVQAYAPDGNGCALKEGGCKLTITCPHCGKPVEVELPLPQVGVPCSGMMPNMGKPPHGSPPPGEFPATPHVPEGMLQPPPPPMPDTRALGGMQPMMGHMREMMERMQREREELDGRFAELNRALEELHRELAGRTQDRDREFRRALDELRRQLEDRDREVFTALERLQREQAQQLEDLWLAIDELFAALYERE